MPRSRNIITPSDWTDDDTRLIQYSILSNQSLHNISKAKLVHSGELVFGKKDDPRRRFANDKRSRLTRSIPAFQLGNSRGAWKELPKDYNPTDYIECFDEDIIRPITTDEHLSQFSHDFTKKMVSHNLK